MSFTHNGRKYDEKMVTEQMAVSILKEVGIDLEDDGLEYTVLVEYVKPGWANPMRCELASITKSFRQLEVHVDIMPYFYGDDWRSKSGIVKCECWCHIVEFLALNLRPRMKNNVLLVS